MRLLAAIDPRFPDICGRRTVSTTGRIALDPGAGTIIPGKAEALFQLRDADPAVLDSTGRGCSTPSCSARKFVGRCKLAVERLSASTPP